MYPEPNKIEREQVEEVFHLGGGELAEKPLRYAYNDGLGPKLLRSWAHYFYDGLPDYVGRELRFRSGTFITIVAQEIYGHMPRVIIAAGKRWHRVTAYRSSGEVECLNGWDSRDGNCPLCDEDHSKESFIYIGDGWSEIVYRTRD